MTSQQQTTEHVEGIDSQELSDGIFTFIGLFLVFVLIFVTIKEKLRDWLMK